MRRRFRLSVVLLLPLLLFLPGFAAEPPTPGVPQLLNAGPIVELDVSFDNVDRQLRRPLVAALASGGSAVLWEVRLRLEVLSRLESRLHGLAGREIARGFTPTLLASGVRMTAQTKGGFTIVSGDDEAVVGQRFDRRGRPLTGPFPLPAFPAAIAAGRDGGLLTLWVDLRSGGLQEISLIAYGPRGQQLGPRRRLRRAPACSLTAPVLASDSSGRAVVAWPSASCARILVRRLDATGQPLGGSVDVSPGILHNPGRMDIAAAPDGRFVVVWEGEGDGDGWGIFARAFGPDDRPLGPAIQVNSRRTGDQVVPRVAVQGDGRFLVIWQSPDERGVRKLSGQYFAADGRRLGNELLLDSELPVQEIEASLATDAAGRYVVAWRRFDPGMDAICYRRLEAPAD